MDLFKVFENNDAESCKKEIEKLQKEIELLQLRNINDNRYFEDYTKIACLYKDIVDTRNNQIFHTKEQIKAINEIKILIENKIKNRL